MTGRRLIGVLLVTTTLIVMPVYTYLLFFTDTETQFHVLKITVYSVVIAISALILIVGYLLLRASGPLKYPLEPKNTGENNEDICFSKTTSN